MEDGVIISEEVDLVDGEGLCSNLLDDVLDNLIIASLNKQEITVALLTTLTFLRWEPLPPVRGSPTFSLSFWMLA